MGKSCQYGSILRREAHTVRSQAVLIKIFERISCKTRTLAKQRPAFCPGTRVPVPFLNNLLFKSKSWWSIASGCEMGFSLRNTPECHNNVDTYTYNSYIHNTNTPVLMQHAYPHFHKTPLNTLSHMSHPPVENQIQCWVARRTIGGHGYGRAQSEARVTSCN